MRKIVNFSLISAALLGLLKIFSIIPFNRLAADDFAYAAVAKNNGFWMAQKIWYTSWTGRFTSTFLQILFTNLTGLNAKIYVYSTLTFGLLFLAFVIFFKRFLKTNLRDLTVYILSAISVVILYFLTPNKTESWYWLTGSVTYLWPVILFTFSASFIFKKNHSIVDFVIADILIFLSIGGNETFGFLAVLVLFWLTIRKFNYFNASLLASATTAFAVVFFSPGNSLRGSGTEGTPMNIFGSILYSIQEGPMHMFLLAWNNLYYLLPVFIIFGYLFSKLSHKENSEYSIRMIFEFSLIPIILSIFFMLPAFKTLGRIPPDRTDTSLAFIILSSLIGISYYLGNLVSPENYEKNILYKLFILAVSIWLIVSSFGFVKTLAFDFYIAKNYSEAYDSMIAEFKEAATEGDKKDITVSLPPAGLIAVTLDPPGHNWYKNGALSQFYGIGRIITKEWQTQ